MPALTPEQVADALRRTAGISAWQVNETRARSTQRYTVFARDEALRQVDTARTYVTLHVAHEQDGRPTLGESSFALGPEADEPALQREIAAALSRARLVHNQRYELPAPGQATTPVTTVDERVVENAAAVVDEAVAQMRDATARHAGVELSSSEVFASYQHQRILNSRGLDETRAETDLLVEYVLLAKDPRNEEHEIWQSPRARLAPDLKLADEIDRYVRYTRDGLSAELPRGGTFDVVLGEEALDSIWDFFVAQAQASALYEGWSRFKPGAPVVADPRGERLTLVSDPTLAGGIGSQRVDAQGQACVRTTLIADNVFQSYVATKKFADLAGVPATGPMGNVVVAAGTRSYAELTGGDRPVYELLRFSQLSPNAISGSFSGEIRTGYLHEHGKRTPVKGGSIAGSILDAFREAYFSRETTRRQSYQGPSGIRLAGVTVAGA